MVRSISFIDSEIGTEDEKIYDLGAIRYDRAEFHSTSVSSFCEFIAGCDFLCGHNIIHHDMKYIEPFFSNHRRRSYIDTLYLSPLLFPCRPYHNLLKDDKLQSGELNDPLHDAKKAEKLFYDEVAAFRELPSARQMIFCGLLYGFPEYRGFFEYLGFSPSGTDMRNMIAEEFHGKICANADIFSLVKQYPVELAYALALIGCADHYSITPPWLTKNFPRIENVIRLLCNTPCRDGCEYCKSVLDIHRALQEFFGFPSFRTYNGEPLQERAAQAAVDGKSLLAVFPTGGGKSITFQLPALMAGKTSHGLTVVISPLQSLMKDQVDHLSEAGIVDAVTVNGLLSPIERAEAYQRVADGMASILYISPEMLRSKTVEKLLLSRNIVRFVIDEAHCFSAWGQDFRVDYLYIGDFIRKIQKEKQCSKAIPVSCFTATAKQKVISDIRDYFKKKLDQDLELFATDATRENLHYVVLFKETEEEKYTALRSLIEQKDCATIVYVSRTRQTIKLAERLTKDGFPSLPFNGKMDPNEKIANQEAFIGNEVKVIVATSAFGMGVDKKDVRLVVHYDISDSLENYVQEAGRAGRDPSLQAECYVLYNDQDLDKHFTLLNQTKLSLSEIQQVWKAIKDMTKTRNTVCCSPLEIARQAGWENPDDSNSSIETRVRTAVMALESAGYIKRGQNVPRVYASGILAKNMQEAGSVIDGSELLSETQKNDAKRIIKSLISCRSVTKAGNDSAESRVDYLADILGIEKKDVITIINLLRQEKLLADTQDMTARIFVSDTENKSLLTLKKFSRLERFLLEYIPEDGCSIDYKECNEAAIFAGVRDSNVKNIKTLLFFLTIKGYVHKEEHAGTGSAKLCPTVPIKVLTEKQQRRIRICEFVISELYKRAEYRTDSDDIPVAFSLVGLLQTYRQLQILGEDCTATTLDDMSDALLYLSKIGAMKLEGGFLVSYNGMEIERLILNNHIGYRVENYRLLDEFYRQKIQQIHIVGEYANLMVKNYPAALQFVQDYFQMDFRLFKKKYFKGERTKEIDRNITPKKYEQIFGQLSETQAEIINDDKSKIIVVAAGPGSGKTRVLVHKLASLLLLEDVKSEQLLMLTFSRAAAIEFKKRLIELIGNAAYFVDIKTFHSYCFDLLGRIGNLQESENVVEDAGRMIRSGEVEPEKITKRVLVIDEAQDMSESEFTLIQSLMWMNDDMRVIAVGDDDQNIYQFRGSSSKHLHALLEDYGARKYEMEENFRSMQTIVALGNAVASNLHDRIKSKPISSVRDGTGIVEIIKHASENMEEAVAEHIAGLRCCGKTCVLTNTNDEALQILCQLREKGVHGKLIQSNEGFSLYNLAELRYFLKFIDRRSEAPVIGDELWKTAYKALEEQYAGSTCLANCLNILDTFSATNKTKYRNDLDEFIKESSYDNYYDDEMDTVTVSTIHKAKGREFDNVILMVKNITDCGDEELRKYYVAITRAKDALYIHCNTKLFDKYLPKAKNIIRRIDSKAYSAPREIELQLTLKDVYLDYFKGKKKAILSMKSGDPLGISGLYFTAEIDGQIVPVAKISKKFAAELNEKRQKGYLPHRATVNFIVAWKGEEDTEEAAVLLPTLHMTK